MVVAKCSMLHRLQNLKAKETCQNHGCNDSISDTTCFKKLSAYTIFKPFPVNDNTLKGTPRCQKDVSVTINKVNHIQLMKLSTIPEESKA